MSTPTPNEKVSSDLKLHLDPITGEQVSKSELKRRLKQREAEAASRLTRSAEKLAITNDDKPNHLDEDDLDPNQYYEKRSLIISELKKRPETYPFPHKFEVSISIPEFISKYEHLENGSHLSEVSLSVSGRIYSKRTASSKLFFYDLFGDGAKVQVMANYQYDMRN